MSIDSSNGLFPWNFRRSLTFVNSKENISQPMGPKRSDLTSRHRLLSQSTLATSTEQVNQLYSGKFAIDLENCCRDATNPYPVTIPVFIRGHSRPILPPVTAAPTPILTAPAPSATSATPSLANGVSEEQIATQTKRSVRTRTSSASQSVVVQQNNHLETDNKSVSTAVVETLKPLFPLYQTFQIIRESEFYRPKLLVDSMHSEHDPIEQIQALYMKGWILDKHFIEILRKIVPLQENLTSISFCHVGLNGKTLVNLIDLVQSVKNLKSLSLDGNPEIADHCAALIQREDSK